MQYVVGDIHGMALTLEKLLKKIRNQDSDPAYVFVGDYCDRGSKSKEVVDICLSLEVDKRIFLRGNHDDIVDYLLNDHVKSDLELYEVGEDMSQQNSLVGVAYWWLQNGLSDTLKSYGVTCKPFCIEHDDLYDTVMKFRQLVPDSHKQFYKKAQIFWENKTHFACHGFLSPNTTLPQSLSEMEDNKVCNSTVLWNRFPADPKGGLDQSIDPVWDKIGIFGHTPVQYYHMTTPIKYKNIRLIDTGAYKGEYLSAYCVEMDDFIFVAHESKDIEKS